MKKILLLGALIVSMLSACQKDDTDLAPGERPDERLNEVLTEYKTQLVSAEHGWKAVLYPEGGSAYNFLLNFSANDRVTMRSDINASTAAEPFESSYRLKALQRPSLLFDTYSYLHILADPDERKSGGERGQGRYSDFEFSFDSATPETITLTGNYHGSKLILTKATQEEANTYIQKIVANAEAFENINNFTTYFKRLTVGENVFDVSVLARTKNITFSYFEGDVMKTFSTSYYFTEDGVTLLEPFEINGFTLTSLGAVLYDEASRKINFTVNDVTASIQEATTPIRIDLQAARRFYTSPPNGEYWIATSGFTLSGVPDSLKVSSISNFYFLGYWPRYRNSGNSASDLMGFVLYNPTENRPELGYGPLAVPTLTNDGRIVYTYIEDLGTIPPPSEPIVTATRLQWTDPQGFHVIQTGANSYDLVSAKDAKAWISFN